MPHHVMASFVAHHVFILHAFPEPFDEHVVHPAALAVHADFDIVLFENVREIIRGKLAPLVGIEYLRCVIEGKRLFQCLRDGLDTQTVQGAS